MNPTLLAREAAAELGALDPRPEPPEDLSHPTRLVRVVDGDRECWINPKGNSIVFETPLMTFKEFSSHSETDFT